MIVFPLCVAMAVSGDWGGVRRLTGQTLGVGFLVGLGLAVAVALTADTLMATVWGPAYAGSGPLLRVLFLTAPFLFVSVIGAMLANALRLERSLMRLMGTATILNITLNGAAIPLWGALGAAWTTLLTEVFIVTGVVFIVIGTLGARQGSRPQPQLNDRNLVGLVSDRPREGT
jgi:O-antigen/teichoic acid export membrane protein